LVIIHDRAARRGGVTVTAEQHASAGGTFVPILMDSWCLEFGQSFQESSVVLHQLIVSPAASGQFRVDLGAAIGAGQL